MSGPAQGTWEPSSQQETIVSDLTVNAGEIRFIASGDEVAYYNLTLGGVYRVDGALKAQNITLNDGSTLIIADGANVTIDSFS